MARDSMVMVLGATKAWNVGARVNGKPATNLFQPTDPLDAKVYAGDGIATLFNPAVAWATDPTTRASLASQGIVKMAVTPSSLGGVTVSPGEYRVEIGCTPAADGLRRLLHYGTIRFLGTSGAGSLPFSLCTWDDMVNYSSQVGELLKLDIADTQFADRRNRAMGLFAQEVIRRYNPRPGGSRRYVSADGTASGSFLRYSPSPDGSPSPTRAQVATWITTAGRLSLNEDVIEANARLAAALVYGSSPGQNNPYQQMADKERALARAAIARAVIEIDTKESPDGNATIRVDRDVIYLT